MINKNIKFIKRFLEPAFLDKKSALKVFLSGITESFLLTTLPLIFIPKISELLSQGNNSLALKYSIFASLLFIVLFILRAKIMYYWYWAMNVPFQMAIYKKYLPYVMRIDPLLFDKNGTGYHLSKFNSGSMGISNIARQLLENIPSIFINISISMYFMFNLGFNFGFIFLTFILFSTYLIWIFCKKEVEILEPSVEINNQISGDVARIIMSKQEVINSDKINAEVKNINYLLNSVFEIEKKAYEYSTIRMSPIWMAPFFFLIILFFIQSANLINLTIGQLTLFIFLMNTFSSSIRELFNIIGKIFEEFNNMKAFWNMVDEPKIKGYDTGTDFVHIGGEIELRAVDFSYKS